MNKGFGVLSLACSLVGCGPLLDLPESPELVSVDEGPWQCLDEAPSTQGPSSATARVQVQACDFITNCANPVTGLSARLCAKRDVGCTNPIVTDIHDEKGLLTVEVPTSGTGFDGYLEVTAPSKPCTDETFGQVGPMLCGLLPGCDLEAPDEACDFATYVRALLFFNPPVTEDLSAPMPLPLLPSAGLPSVVEAAGADLDPTTGNLFITAMDCEGKPAEGVTYGISQHQDKVTQLYVDDGVVSDTSLQTDESGIGGFVGVPPGFAEVVGFNADLEKVGSIGVQAAPFTLTYSALVPSP